MSSVSSLAHRPAATGAVSPEPASETAAGMAALRAAFAPVPGYLNAATLGLPPRAVVEATREAITQWQLGRATAAGYDDAVQAARALYAGLVGAPLDWVAVGSQTSVFAGLVAAALPDDAEVVCVSGDFSSMVFPFLAHADRGVRVRQVPLEDLAASVTPGTTLVAFSLAQSACGSLVDAADVVRGREGGRRAHLLRPHPGRRLAARSTPPTTTSRSARPTSGSASPAAPPT